MIYKFISLADAEAAAIPEPKHVWIDGDIVKVFTGEDIPEDQSQSADQ